MDPHSPGQRPWLRPPRLRPSEATQGEERHASWLELFFDLVFVVGIAELAQQLVDDHTLGGFAIFAGLFLPVYISWQGFTFYADRFDTDDVVFRVVLLAGMLATAALSVQVPDVARGEHTAGFVVAYVVLRSLLVGLYARTWRSVPEARPLVRRYGGGYSIGILIWLASLLVDEPARYVFWGVALAFEYSIPPLSIPLHRLVPVDFSHVPERFALFTIIALGESVVAVALGTADSDWQFASALTAALGFVCVACMWWVYFDRGVGFRLDLGPGPILRFAYAHIPLLAALTAVGAGVHLFIEEVDHHAAHADVGAGWALCGGVTLYLLCLTICQLETARGVEPGVRAARFRVGLALVVLAVFVDDLPPLVVVAVAAVALVALVVYEIGQGLADS
jgi:low temperature requirement protein LtrA